MRQGVDEFETFKCIFGHQILEMIGTHSLWLCKRDIDGVLNIQDSPKLVLEIHLFRLRGLSCEF
jgi:hypothetical protein